MFGSEVEDEILMNWSKRWRWFSILGSCPPNIDASSFNCSFTIFSHFTLLLLENICKWISETWTLVHGINEFVWRCNVEASHNMRSGGGAVLVPLL